MPAKAPSTNQWLAELEKNLEDLETESSGKALKSLIYGPSGTGKTVQSIALAQAITRPEQTILYCDSGNGWVSLENHQGLKRRVKRLQINKITTLEGICNLVEKKAGEFANVGCIVCDEYSTIVDNDLSLIVKERAAKDDTKDPDTPTQPDYNTSKNRGVKFATQLFLLNGVHIILVAHERQDKDSRNILQISPLFNPKLGSRIREAVHLVAYLSIKETRKVGDATQTEQKRVFQVHPTSMIVAKTRIGGLPPEVAYDQLKAVLVEWVKPTDNSNQVIEVEAQKETEQTQTEPSPEGITLEDGE